MPFTLTMPKLSPTMTEGYIAKWHKAPGQYIEAGDLVLEISTDKATVEHSAIDPGWLRKIIVNEGSKAEVNDILAILTDEENEAYEEGSLLPQASKNSPPLQHQNESVKDTKEPQIDDKLKTIEDNSRVFASPLAKKLAAQRGISLNGLKGSGPRGRIMSRDLESIVESTQKPLSQSKNPDAQRQSPSTEIKSVPLTQMRQVIAKRLQESKATIPHFYATVDINATKLVALREELKACGFSFTVNDLIVKAAALALMEHPVVRTTFDPVKQIVHYHPHADISIAVSINGGLITPIVSHADLKSLKEISHEIKELAEKAKSNRLAPHEFMGGNFTISNLGMFGTAEFQAIINPPQTAILAVGAALDSPVVINGMCVPGKVLKLTLSCDHRVVDGADAARFLKSLKELLELPASILLR